MNLIITLFASVSAVLTAFIFYYNLKIVRKFREDEELTATKLVIKQGVPDAFMALSISSMFFSLGAFIGATLKLLKIDLFQYFSELGVITMLVGLLTFMKRIEDAVTEGEKNEAENEESRETEKQKENDSEQKKEKYSEEDSQEDSEEDSEDGEEASKNEDEG